MAHLQAQAVEATQVAFAVVDARSADRELVWVNPAFTRITGYELNDAVGRNCRFLQGPGTDPAAVAKIRAAIDRGEGTSVVMLNYRRDGQEFWNEVAINPIHDDTGRLTHFVGTQTDVSDRVGLEQARAATLQAERSARVEAEHARAEAEAARADAVDAQARLQLLVRATTRLTGSLDRTEVRRRLSNLLIPRLADWMLGLHLDDHGNLSEVSAYHRDPRREETVTRVRAHITELLREPTVSNALHRRRHHGYGHLDLTAMDTTSRLDQDLDGDHPQPSGVTALLQTPAIEQALHAMGSGSLVTLALPGRGNHSELLVLGREPERGAFTAADLEIADDLGRRAGLIFDNLRLFRTQQLIAETLQHSLLPTLPLVSDLTVAVRYRATQSGAQVGGDFYELIELDDKRVGFAIGDVMGHDIMAAAAMGHLTGVLRACAFNEETANDPAAVLERVDRVIVGLSTDLLATAIYAHLGHADGRWSLTFANAGHPPLVIREPSGRCRLLPTASGNNDPLLGLSQEPRNQTSVELQPGTIIVGYTDGLIERRGELIDDGLDRLLRSLSAAPEDLHDLCDHLLADLAGDHEDDVALLALRMRDLPPG